MVFYEKSIHTVSMMDEIIVWGGLIKMSDLWVEGAERGCGKCVCVKCVWGSVGGFMWCDACV